MNFVRRFFSLFRDSPTYGRDQASLLSAPTIGSVALLLNGAVLMVVLPLIMDPNDRSFRQLTQHLEFGQLLSLILLGGATAIATLVIPLRLVSVFWGPRIGRYFDQIVLSGISPIRFVIGKVTSQNLFLALILFLLIPYAVLALALGGVKPVIFLACLFLVWLYCITLALVTLWLSLFLNEMLSAIIVIILAGWAVGLGCIPMPFWSNPFVLTPAPALMQPVWNVVYAGNAGYTTNFWNIFLLSAAGMTTISCVSFAGIYLGPLYGIIRDNSTFGEVVKTGDATKKRRFRLRHHIQRPSELAFFYENRTETFRRFEGLFRWGICFSGLLLLLVAFSALRWSLFEDMALRRAADDYSGWLVYGFHVFGLTIHGFAMAFAIYFFSHARNTTFQEIPFAFGRKHEVGKMDTIAFFLFTAVSVAVTIGLPFLFDSYAEQHNDHIVLYKGEVSTYYNQFIDFERAAVMGTLVLTICGICTYLMQRWLCLNSWVKIVPFLIVAALYGVFICGGFLAPMMMLDGFRELQNMEWLRDFAPEFATASPVVVMLSLFSELPRNSKIVVDPSFIWFHAVHAVLVVGCLLLIRRQSRIVRAAYLAEPPSAPINKSKPDQRTTPDSAALNQSGVSSGEENS